MYVTVTYMKLRAFVDPNLLENTSILRTCCASPAAPVGDFCTGSLLEKTLILRTYYASPVAPVGDFCNGESFGEDFGFVHLLCYSGCTRR
jgi:hypothetical protein